MTSRQPPVGTEPILTPGEVATMFGVSPKTVTRWARTGRLTWFKTLGGHRRFKEEEVRRLLEQGGPDEASSTAETPSS